jgi:transcriptional regulator with XRE-family HTH domain
MAKELGEAEKIGLMLKVIREREGMTQAAVAKAAGIDQTHVCRLESGVDGIPHIDRVKRVLESIGYKLMLTARKSASEYEFTL